MQVLKCIPFLLLFSNSFSFFNASEDRNNFNAISDVLNFCHWPNPYSLAKIRPAFRAYLRNGSWTNFMIHNENDVNVSVANLERMGYFRAQRSVVFIVHGFRDDIEAGYMRDIKDNLLALGEFTVLIVGWEKGAYLSPWNYAQAASNTRTVAEILADMSKAILDTDIFGGRKDQFYLYCIGHSMGAHVCGQAGLKSTGLFDRITGLDPAGPGWANCQHNPSIKAESAQCVDVIHTDGNFTGHLDPVVPHLGALNRWGFVDFYPNGGTKQPGCSVWDNDFRSCSHHRSVGLFLYSMRANRGVCNARGPCRNERSLPDRSCTEAGKQQFMGYYSSCHSNVATDQRVGGVFYIQTTASDPYC